MLSMIDVLVDGRFVEAKKRHYVTVPRILKSAADQCAGELKEERGGIV